MKKIVEKTIFHEIDYDKPIPFSAIKDIVEDNDIIKGGWDDGFYTENNSIEGHFYLEVIRKREETDEEYQKRLENEQRDKEWAEKRQYETYLKLKAKFEPNV